MQDRLAELEPADRDRVKPIALQRLLNRATGEVDAETGFTSAAIFERAGNPIVPISSMLPLNFLPAGGYKIEVSVMRETGDPVVRTADFDVN